MIYSTTALEVGESLAKIVVLHRSFVEALNVIGHAIQMGNGTGLPAGVRLIAPSGCGKSQLLECLRKNIQNWDLLRGDLPVIDTTLKETPQVSQIQGGLIAHFNYLLSPGGNSARNDTINQLLVKSIKQYQVRVIVLDEFQHIFHTSGTTYSASVVDWLKRLMIQTGVPVILMGMPRLEALGATDPQLLTRVPTLVRLHEFKYDEEWLGFVKSFANAATVINLDSLAKDLTRELFLASKGVPRVFKGIVVTAAMIAIDSGEKAVKREHLRLAFNRHFGEDFIQENPF